MGLINQDFRSLTLEEFDETIAGLNRLSFVCIPRLAGNDEDAIELVVHIKLARDALGKIKQQVYGTGEPHGAVDFEKFALEHYEMVVDGMAGLAMYAIPSFVGDIGIYAVTEYVLACMIAGDAVDEIKRQVYGEEGNDGPYKPGTEESTSGEV